MTIYPGTGNWNLLSAAVYLSSFVTYAPAPTTFDELTKLIPPRGGIIMYRFIRDDKPFELRIGRNRINVVFLEFCVPDEKNQLWPLVRRIESLTKQRDIWERWQKFLEDPEMYLTWKYIGHHKDSPSDC